MDIRMILEHMLSERLPAERSPHIRPAAYRVLSAYDWPGNEIELQAFAAKLASQPAKTVYEAHDMHLFMQGSEFAEERVTAQEAQRKLLLQALHRNGFRKGTTAKALNISRKTLYNRMKRFGLT